MLQKIIKVGNSLAITLPSSFVEYAKWKAGQKVVVLEEADSKTLTVQSQEAELLKMGLTPEFRSWLKKFNKRYKDALSELSKK